MRFCFATDRISVFDFVLKAEVKDKGAVLTAMNVFWRTLLFNDCAHDLVAFGREIDDPLPPLLRGIPRLQTRGTVVHSHHVHPIEAITRGYLTGTGFAAYNETAPNHMVCGHKLPPGLQDGSELPEPIFTPTTKAQVGHDEHITFQSVRSKYGREIEDLSLRLYRKAREYAKGRGIIIADTKMEFGSLGDGLVLVDEVLTPDSSRFWDSDEYADVMQKGGKLKPYDKQHVRNWAIGLGIHKLDPKKSTDYEWVRNQTVPQRILDETTGLYRDIFLRLTGATLEEFQHDTMCIAV